MRDEVKYRPLRAQAKELIVKEGLTQKEVAERLEITPKTVSDWYRRNGWKGEREKYLETAGGANSLYDFIGYAREHCPNEFLMIETLYKAYLNTH